ncbi:hypothetical protein CL617_01350 [archaeon]|nr:hypothetical protein [archaeon]
MGKVIILGVKMEETLFQKTQGKQLEYIHKAIDLGKNPAKVSEIFRRNDIDCAIEEVEDYLNPKQKILFVDDDRMLVEMGNIILGKAGYDVRTAISGEEAMKTAENYEPDLTISDYSMPGMTGVELLLKINQIHPNSKLMLCSGSEDYFKEIPEEYRDRVTTVLKPYRLPELQDLVKYSLEE